MKPSSRTQGICIATCTALAFASASNAAEPAAPSRTSLPPIPDSLSGRLSLAPSVGWLAPMGEAEAGFAHRSLTGSGFAFGLDVAYGISRYVAVRGNFSHASFGAGNDCGADRVCSAVSNAAGLGVEYHLVDGAAFDPWLAAGMAYRWTSFDLAWAGYAPGPLSFAGVDWMHLSVGGDWYPHRLVGFGPYLAFDMGTYSVRPGNDVPRPSSTSPEAALHSFFSVGLRGVIAPMR